MAATWGKKWHVEFNAGKTQLILCDWSNNTVSIDVKIYESVLEEKSSFKMLWLTFSSKLDLGSYIISVANTTASNWSIHLFYGVLKCLILRWLCISINLPYGHACNTCHV